LNSEESLELTRKDLETAESKFPGKKEQVDKLKKELQDLIDLDQYDDEIRMIFAKMFWLDAYVANGIVEELESKLRTVQEELQGSRDRVTEAEHANEEIGNFDELNAILAETQEEQTRLSAVADERRTAMNNMGAEIKKAERQIRQLQENKKNNMMQMDAAKKEVCGVLK
jgi:chromosome segregation ATPase